MEPLHITGKEFIPEVSFNPEQGSLSISGKSFLEDTIEFYEPIIDWLKQYIEETYQDTVVAFKMTYFNTTTSKVFLQIIKLLEQYKGPIKIIWQYQADDDDMKEDGENMAAETHLEFQLEAVQ